MELMNIFMLSETPDDWEQPEDGHDVIIRICAEEVDEVVGKFKLDRTRLPSLYKET